MRTRRSFLGLTGAGLIASQRPPAADPVATRQEAVLRSILAKGDPGGSGWHYEDCALAAYFLNERTAEADRWILAERDEEFSARMEGGDFHWHAYFLERLHFLFAGKRMSVAAENAILDMLWRWAGPACRIEMTLPERLWWYWGSENHHAQAWGSFWGAAEIFSRHPEYRNRRYSDGSTPAQMAAAFTEYFKRFARERAAKGLLVECNSDYNKYTLGPWYNMADFASDPVLRNRMRMLIDLYWADWAIEQIDGMRGGSRHRCYPGRNSTENSSGQGPAWIHFGLGSMSTHPTAVLCATTSYRPPEIVMDLALDVRGRGIYEYWSRRPGLALQPKGSVKFVTDPANPFSASNANALNPEGGGLARYSYCTPDFVMGASMVEARPSDDWAAISSQNRWDGVIFGGDPYARIFTQPLNPKKGSVYNAQWSVQRKGVLIVQRLRTSNAKGQRIWFDKSLDRIEKAGWVFAEAPRAFAAVYVVSGGAEWEPNTVEQHREGKGNFDRGIWLKCRDEFSPVIIDVARKLDFPNFAAFQSAVLVNPLEWRNRKLQYRGLTLFADYSQPPLVDGKPVNYRAAKVYDSPFLDAGFGSGVVTIRKGPEKLVLDFND